MVSEPADLQRRAKGDDIVLDVLAKNPANADLSFNFS